MPYYLFDNTTFVHDIAILPMLVDVSPCCYSSRVDTILKRKGFFGLYFLFLFSSLLVGSPVSLKSLHGTRSSMFFFFFAAKTKITKEKLWKSIRNMCETLSRRQAIIHCFLCACMCHNNILSSTKTKDEKKKNHLKFKTNKTSPRPICCYLSALPPSSIWPYLSSFLSLVFSLLCNIHTPAIPDVTF